MSKYEHITIDEALKRGIRFSQGTSLDIARNQLEVICGYITGPVWHLDAIFNYIRASRITLPPVAGNTPITKEFIQHTFLKLVYSYELEAEEQDLEGFE